jgi:hypothetical protein
VDIPCKILDGDDSEHKEFKVSEVIQKSNSGEGVGSGVEMQMSYETTCLKAKGVETW